MKKFYTTKITHKKLRKTLMWITAEGMPIPISEMEETHLINVILYLRKKIAELKKFNLPITTLNNKVLTDWEDIFSSELDYRSKKK
tara:strand:+ start:341 stop:598 length:258 start_codon:yes stop_codon:yes gene_type:complete